MSNYQYGASHYQTNLHPQSSHHNGHHGRTRRGPRVSSSQFGQRQQFTKPQRSAKDSAEYLTYNTYLKDLEAAKGFDFEDDEIFCPFHLLTEDDLHSIHSAASSDRSSLSSGSPEASPLQHPSHPTPSFVMPSAATQHTYQQSNASSGHNSSKIHQPLAQRSRNAIPIVDPSTRSVASPPLSVSPARQMQAQYGRKW